MSAVEAEQEQTVIELLDFEFEPTCQDKTLRAGPECSAPAGWLGVCSACGGEVFLCGRHKAVAVVLTEANNAVCMTTQRPMHMRFFPLGGAA